MFSRLMEMVENNAGVLAVLGNPVRLYSFGEAPQAVSEAAKTTDAVYAVHQVVGGAPENYLGTLPDMDGLTVQVDVYGRTPALVKAAAIALRDAIEPQAYVSSYGGSFRDRDTKLWRALFTVESKDSR